MGAIQPGQHATLHRVGAISGRPLPMHGEEVTVVASYCAQGGVAYWIVRRNDGSTVAVRETELRHA